MEQNWSGPYRIHEVLSKGTFNMCNDSKKVLAQVYNMTRLKLYNQRDDEDTPPTDRLDPLIKRPRDQESPCHNQDALNQHQQESLSWNMGQQRSFLQQLKASDLLTKVSSVDSLVQDIKNGLLAIIIYNIAIIGVVASYTI